jgi:hypothetical protein
MIEAAIQILIGAAAVFAVAAYFTWSICIHRYVQYYRCEPAPFFLPWAPLVDARKAAKIAKRLGHVPGWLTLYRRCEAMAICFGLGAGVTWTCWLLQHRA